MTYKLEDWLEDFPGQTKAEFERLTRLTEDFFSGRHSCSQAAKNVGKDADAFLDFLTWQRLQDIVAEGYFIRAGGKYVRTGKPVPHV